MTEREHVPQAPVDAGGYLGEQADLTSLCADPDDAEPSTIQPGMRPGDHLESMSRGREWAL